ncbi:hypothetical protein ACSSS7_004277 [Eimeria intestinalis]
MDAAGRRGDLDLTRRYSDRNRYWCGSAAGVLRLAKASFPGMRSIRISIEINKEAPDDT